MVRSGGASERSMGAYVRSAGMLLPSCLQAYVSLTFQNGKEEYCASSSTIFVIEFILFTTWRSDVAYLPMKWDTRMGSLTLSTSLQLWTAKNRKLQMGDLTILTFLGFMILYIVTEKGPFDNLLQHLSDPWHNTIV
ncbi:chlorophyll a-b binding protein P4, chloroplastic-like [Impatiens glandulifera]|uniref:chlorophyll a-b binding protein P4, chloroplastic-like n=1 Tax=Impatiens glandulifera TaxID=253017 RepID=UPI001FB08EBB|nr:chlorophyll a-b binding protein P4, chloroplastic-like [Impatiens glandulifera]